MKLSVKLNSRTRHIIRKIDRKTRDADMRIRCRILLKIAQGLSGNEAAREIGCAPSTTSRIVARFRRDGIACLFDGRWENGERKVDDDIRGAIWRIVERRSDDYGFTRPTWTLESLRQVILEEHQVTLSIGHLWKVLRSMGIRLGQPKPFVSCPWKGARRRARIRSLRRLLETAGPGEVVLFLDEVDIHLNPRIGRDWMLPGRRRWVRTPGKNDKRYLAGAYDPKRNRMTYVEGDRKASWLFLNLIRAVCIAYRRAKRIHIILDNYIIHKSACVKAVLRQLSHKLQLHFLPPYCPEANKIERIWKDLHDNVTRNHRHPTIAELLTAVRHWLDSRFKTYRGICYGT